MATEQAAPHISLKERDRRYSLIRESLKDRGLDGVITSGGNLQYMTNGIAGQVAGFLPASDEPFTLGLFRRHLSDLEPQVVIDGQDWVKDIRRSGDTASPMIERIKELHLEKGTIGLAMPGVSRQYYNQLEKGLPDAKLVDASEILNNLRCIKSEEEIAMIDKANLVFDACIEAVHRTAKPGMTGEQVVQAGIKAMWDAGGDIESTFSFNFGPTAAQNPVLADFCLTRQIQPGDIGTLTGHSEFHHYSGHSDQEISFGQPGAQHKEMFEAVLFTREAILASVKTGVTQRELMETYDAACREVGFKSSVHSQVHQYGIDVPEFPGEAFQVPDPGGKALVGSLGRVGNFTLAAGMIYSISPTIISDDGVETILGGTCLVVTDDGYHELGNRKVEMLVVDG